MIAEAGRVDAPPLRLPVIPLAFLIIIAGVLLAAAVREAVPAPVDVDVVYTAHAEKHPEAVAIRRCLENSGALHVWRSRSWRTPLKFYRSCLLPDGTIGLQIVKWSWRALAWREVTSFVVRNGTLRELVEYVNARAALVHGTLR